MNAQFKTEFEEYLYQYSPVRKIPPYSIRVLEDIATSYVARWPGCSLRSCIWDAEPMVVSVVWESPSMRGLSDWNDSFYRFGQPVPLLDIQDPSD